jgi:hypothetical protein
LGYTSYWNNQPKEHNQAKWDMFLGAVKHVASDLPDEVVLGDWDGEGGEPLFSKNVIRFNGVGEMSHETFSIYRKPKPEQREFDFCKTARKPYDLMVCATLSLYWHFFKDEGVKIDSDGDKSDWEPARDLVKKVCGLNLCWHENIDTIVRDEPEPTTIALPVFGIVVNLTGDGGGTITDDIHEEYDTHYNSAIDGITSMILAHAVAGIDIESPAYIEGIETAVEAVSNECA